MSSHPLSATLILYHLERNAQSCHKTDCIDTDWRHKQPPRYLKEAIFESPLLEQSHLSRALLLNPILFDGMIDAGSSFRTLIVHDHLASTSCNIPHVILAESVTQQQQARPSKDSPECSTPFLQVLSDYLPNVPLITTDLLVCVGVVISGRCCTRRVHGV
jgi:hypothetical protein